MVNGKGAHEEFKGLLWVVQILISGSGVFRQPFGDAYLSTKPFLKLTKPTTLDGTKFMCWICITHPSTKAKKVISILRNWHGNRRGKKTLFKSQKLSHIKKKKKDTVIRHKCPGLLKPEFQ